MRTTLDAVRSVKRYLAEALGQEWEVAFADESGAFHSPWARVNVVGPSLYDGPALYSDVTQPMHVACYPEPKESVQESLVEAMRVEELLYGAFRVGVGLGAPMRIPLYDYEGIPMDQPSDRRNEHDYLRVAEFQAQRIGDADDERKIAVVCDLRITWRRYGRTQSGDPVQRVGVKLDTTS